MKAFDIALKDMTRSFRSAFAVVFMFGVPLLVTGMFYFMFGNIAERRRLQPAEDQSHHRKSGRRRTQIPGQPEEHPRRKKGRHDGRTHRQHPAKRRDGRPDRGHACTDAQSQPARAVDSQAAQVAIIIPADFSHQFADVDEEAVIEFYQDPTLTIGPAIMQSILNRFMDGMAGVKIAVNVFLDEADSQASMHWRVRWCNCI